MIDGATGTLSVITSITDTLGTIPTLLMAISGALTFKNVGKPKMFGFNKYADSCQRPLGYQSFLTIREIHECKRRDNMRGKSYTDCHSPISESNRAITGTVRRDSYKYFIEALTVATTPGHSYMQRCYDNMRSVLTECDSYALCRRKLSSAFTWHPYFCLG